MRTDTNVRPGLRIALLAVLGMSLAATAVAEPKFKFETVHSFSGPDGVHPATETPMAVGRDGRLYGVTQTGGTTGNGVLFMLNKGGKFRVVHSFSGGPDGGYPTAVFTSANGTIYGTTAFGGAHSVGVAFRLDSNGMLTTIHDFDGFEAGIPSGSVSRLDGVFYGASGGSGNLSRGTIYSLTTSGQVNIVYDFANSPDEGNPYYGLSGASDGSLYGTTYAAVLPDQHGTIFRLDPAGNFTTLHTFTSGTDGAGPTNPPVPALDGSLYGTTMFGGEHGCGTIYRLDANGTYEVVHSFEYTSEGCQPFGQLVASRNGRIYGTTSTGGEFDQGAIFELDEVGTLRTLYHFTGGEDGSYPQPGLVEASRGVFYGMTGGGGASGLGTIYRFQVR